MHAESHRDWRVFRAAKRYHPGARHYLPKSSLYPQGYYQENPRSLIAPRSRGVVGETILRRTGSGCFAGFIVRLGLKDEECVCCSDDQHFRKANSCIDWNLRFYWREFLWRNRSRRFYRSSHFGLSHCNLHSRCILIAHCLIRLPQIIDCTVSDLAADPPDLFASFSPPHPIALGSILGRPASISALAR